MVELARDVTGTTIPLGHPATLPKGSRVEVTRQDGGTFTIQTAIGLVRVEGRDADALGLPPPPAAPPANVVEPPRDANAAAAAVWERLKSCYDPEIPVDIVEMGLIYENLVEPHPEGGFKVLIRMTLTSPGCPVAGILPEQARAGILSIPGVRECWVEIVWDPPWEPSMMSEAAKLKLGFL
jgi:probable FeS assembly SUF system protein SufT